MSRENDLENALENIHISNRDIKILADAVKRAMLDGNTGDIKRILRQGAHDICIFHRDQDVHMSPLLTEGRGKLSTRNLFMLANSTLPEKLHGFRLKKLDLDLSALGNFLLHLAAIIPDYELVTLLLEKGADITSVTASGKAAVHFACETKCLKTVKLLAEKSPAYILEKIDGDNCTPLDIACENSSPEVVEFLLSKCSSALRPQMFQRQGPLLRSIYNDLEYVIPIASLLLDAGINIEHASGLRNTALIAAIKRLITVLTIPRKQLVVNICIFLIDRGCNVNVTDFSKRSALQLAVKYGQEILVRKLLFSGSDVDFRDKCGRTPLYYACRTQKQKIVDLLINFGANLRAHNWENILNSSDSDLGKDHLFNYVLHKSRHCFSLEDLCSITIRKNVKNLEKVAVQLGLTPFLVKRLLLEV